MYVDNFKNGKIYMLYIWNGIKKLEKIKCGRRDMRNKNNLVN